LEAEVDLFGVLNFEGLGAMRRGVKVEAWRGVVVASAGLVAGRGAESSFPAPVVVSVAERLTGDPGGVKLSVFAVTFFSLSISFLGVIVGVPALEPIFFGVGVPALESSSFHIPIFVTYPFEYHASRNVEQRSATQRHL
jgi:hypothetical protein